MSETSYFIFIGLFVLLTSIVVFDIYIIKKKGKQESISAYIIRGAKKYSALFIPGAVIFGYVCGHLFWSMDTFDYLHKEELTKRCEAFLGR